MADQITNCTTYKEGSTIKYHRIEYTLDDGTKFDIDINAAEMSDPADTTELQTLANAKATDAKTSRQATTYSSTVDSSLNGNVTI